MLITRSMELLSCLSSVWLSFDRYSSNRCNALWVSCFRTGIFSQKQEEGTHTWLLARLLPAATPAGAGPDSRRSVRRPRAAHAPLRGLHTCGSAAKFPRAANAGAPGALRPDSEQLPARPRSTYPAPPRLELS